MGVVLLRKLFSEKPYLAWYVKDSQKLSVTSLVEHVLNYGQWEDYLVAEKSLGIKQAKKIFFALRDKKRTNLRPPTINYFEKYFQKYA